MHEEQERGQRWEAYAKKAGFLDDHGICQPGQHERTATSWYTWEACEKALASLAKPQPVGGALPGTASALAFALSVDIKDAINELADGQHYPDLLESVDRLATLSAPVAQPEQPRLAVWFNSMPESNGKKNWTVILHRKDEGIEDGITFQRTEYQDRARYEADCLRHLIGELAERPDVLAYDSELGAPQAAPVAQPGEAVPHGWLYDWTHSSATGKPDEEYTGFTTDETHAKKHDNARAVYLATPIAAQPAAAEPVPSTCDGKEQDAFEEWALGQRYKMDLHPMFYLFLETKTAAARDGWKAGLEYAVKRMLAAPAQAAAVPDGWKQAIDNELVSLHIGTAESFATPELALKEVIDWHVQVSLDPSVSSDAEALVERGRRAAAVPEGWKLAPVEPTQAMCTAAQELNEYDTRRGALTLNSNIYRTMIDAAPEAGAGGDK